MAVPTSHESAMKKNASGADLLRGCAEMKHAAAMMPAGVDKSAANCAMAQRSPRGPWAPDTMDARHATPNPTK